MLNLKIDKGLGIIYGAWIFLVLGSLVLLYSLPFVSASGVYIGTDFYTESYAYIWADAPTLCNTRNSFAVGFGSDASLSLGTCGWDVTLSDFGCKVYVMEDDWPTDDDCGWGTSNFMVLFEGYANSLIIDGTVEYATNFDNFKTFYETSGGSGPSCLLDKFSWAIESSGNPIINTWLCQKRADGKGVWYRCDSAHSDRGVQVDDNLMTCTSAPNYLGYFNKYYWVQRDSCQDLGGEICSMSYGTNTGYTLHSAGNSGCDYLYGTATLKRCVKTGICGDGTCNSGETSGNCPADCPVVDTCTCPGPGNNWVINMADSCDITSDCDLGTGKLSFIGTGSATCDATISTTDLGDPGSGGTLYIQDNCLINVD